MKQIKLLLLLLIIASFAACNKTNSIKIEGIDAVYSFDLKNAGDISSLIKEIEYIPLENAEDGFLREVSKMLIDDTGIYIWDMRTHRIAVYDLNGNHLYTLDKRGKGPEEYVEIGNFAMDDSILYVIDNYTNKLRFYDKFSATYIESRDLPLFVHDIAVLNNGDFIFCFSPHGSYVPPNQTPHRIFITDNDINIKQSILPYEVREEYPIGKRFFFTMDDDRVYYNVAMRDEFYSFSKDEPYTKTTYLVDYGKNAIPDMYRNNYEKCLEYKYSFINDTPIILDGYILFNILDDDNFDPFIYNTTEKKWYTEYKSSPLYYVDYASAKNLYAIIYGGYDYEFLPDKPDSVKKHLDEDGWVLVKYVLK